ncbi:MAG: hypothetical protein IPK75_12585 [Acidobacteria bacterium]|nr:hypothetical protein [Acidobacteriota bacterium]
MKYRCDECGHQEVIWNSRDGVTPFSMGCPSCGGLSLLHCDFRGDVYAPGHALNRGQRFWRDGTPEEAEAIMRRRFEMMRAEYPIAPERAEEIVRQIRDGTCTEFRPGWPTIDRHAEQT